MLEKKLPSPGQRWPHPRNFGRLDELEVKSLNDDPLRVLQLDKIARIFLQIVGVSENGGFSPQIIQWKKGLEIIHFGVPLFLETPMWLLHLQSLT